MEKSLKKLEKLSENVRLIDQPRTYSYNEVKKLIEISYLEGQQNIMNMYGNSTIETSKKINELLKKI